MITFGDLSEIGGETRLAVINLLYRLGDDELVMGHRSAESADLLPALVYRAEFSAIAHDEIRHAGFYYEMLRMLDPARPEVLLRSPREFRCASLASRPPCKEWEPSVLRQFLYDAAEMVRLTALRESRLTPLAALAGQLREREHSHLAHGRRWVLQLSRTSSESHEKLQNALDELYPYALGIFEPTEADEPLTQAGICPHEEDLRRQWESAVAPVIAEAALGLPETVQPVHGGRVGRHSPALVELLECLRRRVPMASGAPEDERSRAAR